MSAWVCSRGGQLRIKSWADGTTVVYDAASGDTHVVDPLAAELLALLDQRSPQTTNALVAELGKYFHADSEAQVTDRIDRYLSGLVDIGLVVGSAD